MIRKAALCALGALLLPAAPATSAPVPAISDGFVASGLAGSQTVVRVTRDLPMPGVPGYFGDRRLDVTATGGPVAGFAFVGAKAQSYVVGSTARWACGAATCPDARLLWGSTWAPKYNVLPAGEYVLVLIGTPGTRVDVSMPPLARNARPVRVATTPGSTPEVEVTEDVSTGSDADVVALGSWHRARPATGRALVGVVHTVKTNGTIDAELTAGSPGLLANCGPAWQSASRSGDPLAWPLRAWYRTTSLLSSVDAGEPVCVTWQGRVTQGVGTQRGAAFYVPLVRAAR